MIVLVTGCRSGFGLLTAVSAARAGHTVYAGLRDLSTRADLDAASQGLAVTPVQLDVTNEAQRESVVAEIIAKHGRIDALVNNAGIALGGYQEEVTEAEVRRVFEVNVLAVWALTQQVVGGMRERRFGHIINVSSASGRIALPGLGIYAGSKFALEGLSESLRHELSPFGVQVTVVQPGPYKTDMTQGQNRRLTEAASSADSPYAAYNRKAEALFNRIASSMGDPQDIADRIVDILDEDRPRFRHPMGLSAKARLFATWLLPFSVWEWVVGRLTRP